MQIVGYASLDPALFVAETGSVERMDLAPGTELAYTLGERHCAGTTTDDGTHHPCERPRAPYCELHTTPWSVANNADSEEEHAVYLAGFTPRTFKVGVTRSWRLDTRLREQGADRAAHVLTTSDGRAARDRETQISTEYGVTERVRVATKVRGLAELFDEAAWEALLDPFEVHEAFAFEYGLELGERPVAETLLCGTVVGMKGRVLLLSYRGTTYAVDCRDLVGYDLESGAPDRDLQASLGGFG